MDNDTCVDEQVIEIIEDTEPPVAVFANGCAMLAGLYILFVHKKMICRDGLHLQHFKDSAKRLGYIALPAGLTGAIQPITNAVIIALLAGYSAEAVAAFGVVTRLEAFAFTVIMALATGMAPIIGQNWGAENYERVNKTLKTAFIFATLWSLLTAFIFIVFAKPIMSAFAGGENNAELVSIAVLYFWIVALTYAPGNLVQGWGSAFNAMGMPKRTQIPFSESLSSSPKKTTARGSSKSSTNSVAKFSRCCSHESRSGGSGMGRGTRWA